MEDVVVTMPLTDVERRLLETLGRLDPAGDDGLALGLVAARVQSLRDGGGLGQDFGGQVARGLEIAGKVLCLLLASHPAEGRQTVVERARLFSPYRGRTGCRVAMFTTSALEADRRRLGLSRRDLC